MAEEGMPMSIVNGKHGSSSLIKAPFGYYGAKTRLAKRLVAMLPPHNAWVEGFCGSAAITLAKPPAPIEVINDADGEIVNLFRVLRNDSTRLCRAVALTPYSREEYFLARSRIGRLSALERARRFLVATMMTVNGMSESMRKGSAGFSFSNSYARDSREARVNRWYNLPQRLEAVVERLRNVRIENRDAVEIVQMFSDRPATLLYLDPPYLADREHQYAVDSNTEEFHSQLLDVCKSSKCMIVISGYDSDFYRHALREKDGWFRHGIDVTTRDTTGKDFKRTEVIWTNKRFVNAALKGRVPIKLSTNEKQWKKLNPARGVSVRVRTIDKK